MNGRRALIALCGAASVACFALAGYSGLRESGRQDDPAMALGWIAVAGLATAGAAVLQRRGEALGRAGAVVFGVVSFWSAVFAWLFFARDQLAPAVVLAAFAAFAAALALRSWWSVRDG